MELLDVYPTLAALAGLPRPSFVQGNDLSPLIVGDDVGTQEQLNTASAKLSNKTFAYVLN